MLEGSWGELGKDTAPTLETGVARGDRALRFEFASTGPNVSQVTGPEEELNED